MYRNTNCKLQAHRGVCTEAPENTMAAFRLAVEQGYDIIEFDPKCTKDGVWVVHHDMTLNRTGRISGKTFDEPKADIRDYTYNELAAVDVGEWFDKKFAGECIPTLTQVFDYLRGQGVEGKIDNVVERFSAGQQRALWDLVEQHADTEKMGLTSTKVEVLGAYGKRFPKAPLHFDGEVNEKNIKALTEIAEGHEVTVWMRLADNEMTAWNKQPPATPDLVELVKNAGFALGIWILHDDEWMQKALALGADVVETTGGIKP